MLLVRAFATLSLILLIGFNAEASMKIIKRKNITAYYNEQGKLAKVAIDTNHDGKADLIKFIKNGKVYEIKKDSNHDGHFDTTIYLKNGKVSMIEKDTNADKKIDVYMYFKNGRLIKKKADRNHDGKIDYLLIKKSKGEAIEKIDTNHDGKFDVVNYYKHRKLFKCVQNGKEIFYNSKGLPIKVSDNKGKYIYKNGKLDKIVFKNRVVIFEKGEKKLEKIDSNSDGKFDTFIYYKKGQISKIEKDRNFDGSIDFIQTSKNNKKEIDVDKNYDGFFNIKLFVKNNKIIKKEFFKKGCKFPVRIEKRDEILFDKNCDGKFEKIEKIKPNRIDILLDSNEDGKIEKKFIFDKNHRLVEIMKDKNHDGKFDTFITYKNKHCFILKRDTNGNGKIDLWKTYKNNKLVSVQKDLNGDGKPDITY